MLAKISKIVKKLANLGFESFAKINKKNWQTIDLILIFCRNSKICSLFKIFDYLPEFENLPTNWKFVKSID